MKKKVELLSLLFKSEYFLPLSNARTSSASMGEIRGTSFTTAGDNWLDDPVYNSDCIINLLYLQIFW